MNRRGVCLAYCVLGVLTGYVILDPSPSIKESSHSESGERTESKTLEPVESCCATPARPTEVAELRSKWLPPEDRTDPSPSLRSFLGFPAGDSSATATSKPLILGFVYTRCGNPRKCRRTAATMHALCEELRALGQRDLVDIALATYDPEFDTPERLASWGSAAGIRPADGIRWLRPDPSHRSSLIEELAIAVNFSNGEVNVHGLQIFVFDRHLRLARTFAPLLPQPEALIADVATLSRE